jgi:DNA-binding transcriptional ArsR family regulator
VNDLVRVPGLAQPQLSKHLRVLREVGAVEVRGQGRQRLYRVNGRALKPIHDWVKSYERRSIVPNERIVSTEVDSGMEAGMQDALDLLEEAAVSLG